MLFIIAFSLFALWEGMYISSFQMLMERKTIRNERSLQIVFAVLLLCCNGLLVHARKEGVSFWYSMFVIALLMIAIVFMFFQGSVIKKLGVVGLSGFLTIIASRVCDWCTNATGKMQQEFSVLKVTDYAIFTLCLLILQWSTIICLQLFHGCSMAHLKEVLLYLVFPLSQLLVLNRIELKVSMKWNEYTILLTGILICLLTDIVFLVYLLKAEDKKKMREQLHAMEYEQQLRSLQQDGSQKLQKQIASMQKDFEEKMREVAAELKQGNTDRSHELLKSTKERINDEKLRCFCMDPVINTILLDKAAYCEEHEVDFLTEMNGIRDIRMNPVELCSLFSNMIDNAIHAAQNSQKGFVEVKAKAQGEYLILRVKNTACEMGKQQDPSRRHYGQQIIREIIKQYHGDWYAEWHKEQGIYEAAATIRLPEETL